MVISTLDATNILTYITGEREEPGIDYDSDGDVDLSDVIQIISYLTSISSNIDISSSNSYSNILSIYNKDVLKVVSNLNDIYIQQNFFKNNLNQQLRGYYISQGNNLELNTWDNNNNPDVNTSLLIDPDIDSQQNYFKFNLYQQFRSYYIAKEIPNVEFYDSIADENILLTFNLDLNSTQLTNRQKEKLVAIYESVLLKRLEIAKNKIITKLELGL
tara:strand:+ start:3458 stop:4105 length:648 start_codon:yes stop_codon:yes gene_type:complete